MKTRLTSFVNIPFWGKEKTAAVQKIGELLNAGIATHIVTVNAEMLIDATKKPAVASAIMHADFFIADSTAVAWWLHSQHKQATHIPGIDFAQDLLVYAEHQHVPVAFFGGATNETAERCARAWRAMGVTVVIAERGPLLSETHDDAEVYAHAAHRINTTRPAFIFVGFGHGKQEVWIEHLRTRIAYPAIYIGVGGAIDVWGGAVRRAPRWMRRMRIEWLWRLMIQPARFVRIMRAVIIFPVRAFVEFLVYS